MTRLAGASAVLALLLAIGAAGAEETSERGPAYLEVSVPRGDVFVGEPITIRLRVGFDESYLRTHGVSLFLREVDVPLHVSAPWLRDLPGTETLLDPPSPPASSGRLRIAVNDDVVSVVRGEDTVVGDRSYAVVEIVHRVLPTTPGTVRIPAATLRFAHATEFEEDFLGGRMPVDRKDVVLQSEAPGVRIRALPAEGRPTGFNGAIGRFAISGRVLPAPADDGTPSGVLQLVLHVEGRGNLEVFDPPRLDDLDGFHVLGAIDERGPDRRTITYDLAPTRRGLTRVPPIELAFLDPGPPAVYRVARTSPIPLDPGVLGSMGSAPEDAPGDVPDDLPRARTPSSAPKSWWGIAFAAVVGLVALLLMTRRARRRARSGDAESASSHGDDRIRKALVALRARLELGGDGLADAFTGFLAAYLGTTSAAVIGPDLSRRLTQSGLDPQLAARLARATERLVASRYAEGGDAGAAIDARLQSDVSQLVEEIAGTMTSVAGGSGSPDGRAGSD